MLIIGKTATKREGFLSLSKIPFQAPITQPTLKNNNNYVPFISLDACDILILLGAVSVPWPESWAATNPCRK